MSVMKDYANQHPRNRKQSKTLRDVSIEILACSTAGAILGIMLGYGLLYTGV